MRFACFVALLGAIAATAIGPYAHPRHKSGHAPPTPSNDTAASRVATLHPTTCDACTVFEDALWCADTMTCYLPRTHGEATLHDVQTVCAAGPCDAQCSGAKECFHQSNLTCGDCVFVGGWWSPAQGACYFSDRAARVCRADPSGCITLDAACPPCDRYHAPLHCSALSAVVAIGVVAFSVFAFNVTWLCVAARRKEQATLLAEVEIEEEEEAAARADVASVGGTVRRKPDVADVDADAAAALSGSATLAGATASPTASTAPNFGRPAGGATLAT